MQFENIKQVHSYVRKNGELTNQAKSCWGSDNYELKMGQYHVIAMIQDEGYTSVLCVVKDDKTIFTVHQTCEFKPKYCRGTVKDMQNFLKALAI